jgi:hypothetical protein
MRWAAGNQAASGHKVGVMNPFMGASFMLIFSSIPYPLEKSSAEAGSGTRA